MVEAAPRPPARRSRKIFVAYPYSIPKADYRRPFNELASAFNVTFEFADQRITNRQILDKIEEMIMTSRFSLFDISTWNANVALELGIAIGAGRDYLGGLDRIQYTSYAELQVLAKEPGLRIAEIADRLDVPVAVAQVVARPFVGDLLETTGRRKGMRYYIKGTAPRRPHSDETAGVESHAS